MIEIPEKKKEKKRYIRWKSISLVENGDAELTNNSEDAVVVKIATTQDKGDLKSFHNKYDEFSIKTKIMYFK